MKPEHFKYNLAKSIFFLLLVSCFVLILTAAADAHRVNLFAWIEGDTVYVESKFGSGRRVNAGKITVFDSGGNELLSGMTNENGEFSFKVPKKTDLKIVLNAGEGHRAEWSIPATEIGLTTTEKRQPTEESLPVKNILIGIGCIFGLSAIVAAIRKRKKNSGHHGDTEM